MTTQELERLIEAQSERSDLEFKGDMSWSAKSLAKDILAMSNIRNGGIIIIGVAESGESFVGEGVSSENLKTYKSDHMKDEMSKYADPFVSFDVSKPSDKNGRKYVVIKVSQFSDVPVISKIDHGDVKKGRLYYRSKHRRPESAAISNSMDLRDLLDIAVVQLMRNRQEAGYTVNPNSRNSKTKKQKVIQDQAKANSSNEARDTAKALAAELKQLPDTDILKIIKTKGFWEIRFMPAKLGKVEPQRKLLEIVEKSQVRLDWPFPNIPQNGIHPAPNCFQSELDYGARKEFWRIFQSEQFYYIGALVEDWLDGDLMRGSMAKEIKEGEFVLIFTSLIHLVTQAFSFLANLTHEGFYGDGVTVQMTMHKTSGRKLYIDAANRKSFDWPRSTIYPEIALQITLSTEQAIQDSLDNSTKLILDFYEKFQFYPNPESIKTDQLKFLNRRQ